MNPMGGVMGGGGGGMRGYPAGPGSPGARVVPQVASAIAMGYAAGGQAGANAAAQLMAGTGLMGATAHGMMGSYNGGGMPQPGVYGAPSYAGGMPQGYPGRHPEVYAMGPAGTMSLGTSPAHYGTMPGAIAGGMGGGMGGPMGPGGPMGGSMAPGAEAIGSYPGMLNTRMMAAPNASLLAGQQPSRAIFLPSVPDGTTYEELFDVVGPFGSLESIKLLGEKRQVRACPPTEQCHPTEPQASPTG